MRRKEKEMGKMKMKKKGKRKGGRGNEKEGEGGCLPFVRCKASNVRNVLIGKLYLCI